jgi:hypothetical protein
VSIANPGGTPLSGYQVHVALGSGFDFTKVRANGADIRFTASDGVTLLPFWIESWKGEFEREPVGEGVIDSVYRGNVVHVLRKLSCRERIEREHDL